MALGEHAILSISMVKMVAKTEIQVATSHRRTMSVLSATAWRVTR
jgi:hypothetical protein